MANNSEYFDKLNVAKKGMSPETSTVISSKVKMYSSRGADGEIQLGVLANFDPSESRSIETVRGVGYGDQIAELVPGVTDALTINVTRAAQYTSNLTQAFNYKGGLEGMVRSLRHHRWPFDIRQEMVFSKYADTLAREDFRASGEKSRDDWDDIDGTPDGGDNAYALITVYEGCWFNDTGTSFSADTAIVQENGSIQVTNVHDGEGPSYYALADTGNAMISGIFGENNQP